MPCSRETSKPSKTHCTSWPTAASYSEAAEVYRRGELIARTPLTGALRRMRPPGRRVQRALPELLRHEHDRAVACGLRELSGDARPRRRHGAGRGDAAF